MSDARITQEAADWHARLRSPSLTEADKTRFRTWLAGSPCSSRKILASFTVVASLPSATNKTRVARFSSWQPGSQTTVI